MPTIEYLNGIKINIYNGEHRPPHLHAIYNEFEVILLIERKRIYAGQLPERQLKLVVEWLEENKDWALEVFYELNPKLK